MNVNEKAIVTLEIDDSQSATRMAEVKSELQDINKQLKQLKTSGEEGSEGYKALKVQQRELKEEFRDLKHNIDLSSASIDDMNEALRHWKKEMSAAKNGTEEYIEAAKKVGEIRNRISEVKEETDALGGILKKQPGLWDSMKVSIMSVFTGLGLFELLKGAGRALLDFGMEVFNTTAKFEKYEAVLKNTLGTQEAATKAMGDIKKFAAETPFSVDELTESYVKYVNRGLQPTMAEMRKLGDIAASQGKSFDQLTEAVLDAATGEFERLKEFGIAAKKNGNEVELSFKGVQKTVANTPEAIKGALLSFGELKGVMGGMAAISQTLEGRVSNLGDNFDGLKLLIGEGLKPVFGAVIDVMSGGIEIIKKLLTSSQPITEVFDSLAETVGNAAESFVNFLKSVLPATNVSVSLRDVIGVLAYVFQGVATPVRVFISLLQGGYDAMAALVNIGKATKNFFSTGEFKLDPSATFGTMRKNFEDNMTGIKNSWTKTASEVNVNTMKDALDNAIKTENARYNEAKNRIAKEKSSEEQKLTEFQKLNADHDQKLKTLQNESLKKQATEKITIINKTAKSEEERAEKTTEVLRKMKADWVRDEVEVHKKGSDAKVETDKKEAEKRKKEAEKLADDKAKAEADMLRKIEDMQVKAIADDISRKFAQAELDWTRELKAIENSKASNEAKNKAIEAANALHEAKKLDIIDDARAKEEKAKDDQRKKDEAAQKKKEDDEKKYRNDRLKAENDMLDAGFKAEIERAKLDLSLTKENSKEMYDAKIALLEKETAYKNAKLVREAAAEKKKIEESVLSESEKAKAIQSIDDRLTDALKQNSNSLENERVKAQDEANEKRKENNRLFYNILSSAMTGDLASYLKALREKLDKDQKANKTRLGEFAQHVNRIGDKALQGVELLTALNAKYTKRQLDNLTSEKNANFAKLDAEYKKGKITKEQLESEKNKLQEKFDGEALELKRKEFERNKKMQIATALIQGSMAVLSALATPPFPLGLVLAVTAGVKTAIDIAKIRKSQFEARDGYISNAGVLSGGRHGSSYGQGGIAMIDRESGQEVGEAEGGEAFMILSRETTQNNMPVIRRLMNSSLNQNGKPITMRNGGFVSLGDVDYMGRYFAENGAFGGGDEYMKSYNDGRYESSGSSGGGESYGSESASPEAMAAIEENKQIAVETQESVSETADNTNRIADILSSHTGILQAIADKPSGISLHDLNSALAAANNAGEKSNM